ncbi:hypothetical protein H0H92_004544 [Tricholoma furcatifolium]|nr:hypothetical protein H0H92_004544 [Tricholoma furcatifolium]
MAARLARLPRLTLFSGPNSVASSVTHNQCFQRPFQLETINIQDPGQEKWKKKYVYWIPALHLEGKEIAKGQREHGPGQQQASGRIEHHDPFFVDTGLYANWEPNGIYVRVSETVLGDENSAAEAPSSSLGTTSACFNCGEPSHIVGACPQPINRELVALSRDLFAFLKAERGAVDYRRIHEVEEWRQQRLEFLDIFEPGEIRGATLRDALGGEDGGWLENMALWGYPKGWVNTEDPREKVRQMIWNEYTEDDDQEDFMIYGEDDAVERVSTTHGNDDTGTESEDSGDEQSESNSLAEASSSTLSSNSPPPSQPIRWANYPMSHFSSQLLPIYNGFMLPPISHHGSSTYTNERRQLWEQITSGHLIPPPPDTNPPPLPSEPPPPLPLSPPFPRSLSPERRPPIQMLHLVLPPSNMTAENTADEGEMDMDMSDSD